MPAGQNQPFLGMYSYYIISKPRLALALSLIHILLPGRHADNFFEDLAEILGVGIAYHLADLLHGAILLLQVYLGFFDAQVCNIVDKMHPGLDVYKRQSPSLSTSCWFR